MNGRVSALHASKTAALRRLHAQHTTMPVSVSSEPCIMCRNYSTISQVLTSFFMRFSRALSAADSFLKVASEGRSSQLKSHSSSSLSETHMPAAFSSCRCTHQMMPASSNVVSRKKRPSARSVRGPESGEHKMNVSVNQAYREAANTRQLRAMQVARCDLVS